MNSPNNHPHRADIISMSGSRSNVEIKSRLSKRQANKLHRLPNAMMIGNYVETISDDGVTVRQLKSVEVVATPQTNTVIE